MSSNAFGSDERRVEVTTIIRAPRETVFDAWLSPERIAVFLCAGDTRVTAVEVEPHVGGSFRVVMTDDRGSYEHRGTYLEIDRPSRLRFTWIADATERRETYVLLTFVSVDDGTRVTLVHVDLPNANVVDQYRSGWRSILEKLADTSPRV
jgi:uncharacterized protein YndB with AHSA1/START domain